MDTTTLARALGLSALALMAAPAAGATTLSTETALSRGAPAVTFEVAEIGTRFVFDEAPVDDAGFPLYGNPFLSQGFIYPAGTLDPSDPARDGVVVVTGEDGTIVDVEPEFPDLVLGTWVCEGTVFADDGFSIETGPTVVTTQIYEFTEVSGAFGGLSIVTKGFELIDLDVEIRRAVLGGTGAYAGATGEVGQTFLGVNESGGFTFRYQTDLE